jgi:cytidylate kinase
MIMPEKETEMNAVKKYPVITISREYGALGRTLAAELSERLGIPYYDKDFVKKAADESGYAEEEVKTEGEELKPSSRMLNSILNSAVSYSSSHDAIFKAQKKVVLELAKDPCIIVGRCADFILKDYDNVIRIFLHAPESFRLEQAALRMSLPPDRLQKWVEKENASRAEYYKYYTGREWTDVRHFDLSLDTSRIGFEKCAELIKGYMKLKFEGLEF